MPPRSTTYIQPIAVIADLPPGFNRASALPRNAEYLTRSGKRVYLYSTSTAPKKCFRFSCICSTLEEREHCSCIPFRMSKPYGKGLAYGLLPSWEPLKEAR